MHVNETVIDVKVETSGMSKTEANKILLACTEAKQSTQNHSNIVQNTLIEINEAIVDSPELLNDESYADKWLVKIESSADQVEFADLLDYSDYLEEVQ